MHLCKLINNDPNYWRARSEQLRSAASKTPDRKAKATMTGVAEGYDKLAHDAVRRRHQKIHK
jgi:hypothetical protein